MKERRRKSGLLGRLPQPLRLPTVLAGVVLLLLAVWLLLPKGAQKPEAVAPDWVVQDLLPINEFSRPGTPLEAVNGIVIHYTGNPGTTAEQNRNYFAGLAETGETHASSNFIVGLEGEALQLVPSDEMAYASGQRNADTLSIEVCHPDDTGEFTRATDEALVELVRWLARHYDLDRDQILRHYDVTGKECPRWFVTDPAAWEDFLDRIEAE